MTAYYNEIDTHAADWLRNLIAEGHVAAGHVDTRSIVDVRPSDLDGFSQCHFFAGIGGWSLALRYAGWPDAEPVWTGSCPCQPFSPSGNQKGFADPRHLWPELRRLIAERCPSIVFGEQVANAADWLRLVRGDLEAMEYAVGAMPIQASSAGAFSPRARFFYVAVAPGARGWRRTPLAPGNSKAPGRPGEDIRAFARPVGSGGGSTLSVSDVLRPSYGVPNRVGLLRGFGNAIDPRPAAAFIKAAVAAAR